MASIARIIAEAAVRLVTDRKGLGTSIRREFRAAIKEAAAGGSLFDDVNKDSDDSSKKVGNTWRKVFSGLKTAASGFTGAIGGISKLLLIGTVAAGAVAGVVSLTTSVLALGQALVAASGVAGLLPAVLAGFAAIKATLAVGLSGVSEGFKAMSEDAATFNEAIKNLAPNAQEFLRALREQKGAFDDLKLATQNRLFEGLAAAVQPLANKYLPLTRGLLTDIAGSLNSAARQALSFVTSGRTVGTVGTLFDNLKLSVNNLSGAFAPAIAALLDITTVGSSFLPGFAESINHAALRFAEFIRQARESGRLQEFFQNAIDTLKQLGDIIGNVFGALRNIMGAANAEGAGLLDTIQSITQSFQDWTGSTSGQEALRGFFESMQRVVKALGPAFFSLIEIIGRDFIPILADIAEIIGPVLKPLFEVFGRLLQSLRPLIQALADAFATALEALGPFFDALATAINDAMPTLGPIIEDIGKAFAELFTAMVPLAPLFVQLLEALLPIIPPFIRMIAEIMPELIELIEALMPVIEALAQAFIAALPILTDVINFLLNVFVPIIQFVGWVIGGLITIVTNVLVGIWNVVTTVLSAVGQFFVGIWNDITSQVSGAWNAIIGFFRDGIGNVLGAIGQWAIDLWNKFLEAMRNIGQAVLDGINNVMAFFNSLPGKILDFFKDAGRWLFDVGKNIIQGLINGIKAMIQKVIDTVKGLINDSISMAQDLLGVHSPSTVFREIGMNIGQGLAQGLEAITPAVADAAAAMVNTTTDAFGNPLGMFTNSNRAASVTKSQGVMVVHQTNVMQPGTDVKQFSDLVFRRGMGDLLSGASTLMVARNGVQAGVNDQWVRV